MNPDVDRAAGLVATELGLTTGTALDDLQAAAWSARTVEDLPGWARATLLMIEERNERDRQRTADGDGGPEIDYTGMDDQQRLWTEAAERQMIPPGAMHITPPPISDATPEQRLLGAKS